MHPERLKNPGAKRPTVKDKDLDAMVKAVWSMGWWARKCATGHVMCYHPTDMREKVLVNNTASDPFTVRKVRQSFARAGVKV